MSDLFGFYNTDLPEDPNHRVYSVKGFAKRVHPQKIFKALGKPYNDLRGSRNDINHSGIVDCPQKPESLEKLKEIYDEVMDIERYMLTATIYCFITGNFKRTAKLFSILITTDNLKKISSRPISLLSQAV